MGSYAEEQRLVQYLEQHKEDYELKTIGYKKIYLLFNFAPVLKIIDFRGCW